MIQHQFPAAERISQIPRGRYFGVGIGNRSNHGVVLANGYPIGPGSPLVLNGEDAPIALEALNFTPGVIHVQVATCPAELAALMRPRPAYEERYEGTLATGGAASFEIPFHGRRELAGQFHYTGTGSPTALAFHTKTRLYYADGSYLESYLNSYDETDIVDNSPAAFYETERAEVLVVQFSADTDIDYRLRLSAFDEGT